MTELEFTPDPRVVIDELRRINESQFLSHRSLWMAQLEHIFVNANRFVLLVYAIDWPESDYATRDEVLRDALWIREQSEHAFREKRLEDSMKDTIWEKYWECAQSLVDLFAGSNKQLAVDLEKALG